jgi:hypothetical protein
MASAAQHLGHIGCHNGQFGQQPERNIRSGAIAMPACLGEIEPRGDPQPQRQRLQDNGSKARRDQHEKQIETEGRTRCNVGRPIAGVHIADRDQQARHQHARHAAQKERWPLRMIRRGAAKSWRGSAVPGTKTIVISLWGRIGRGRHCRGGIVRRQSCPCCHASKGQDQFRQPDRSGS